MDNIYVISEIIQINLVTLIYTLRTKKYKVNII